MDDGHLPTAHRSDQENNEMTQNFIDIILKQCSFRYTL